MKFLKIALMALCLASANIFAQEIGFGAHAAFEYGFLWGLDEDWDDGAGEDNPSGIGFLVGVQGRYEVTPFLHLTPEINFRYSKLGQETDFYEVNFTQMDLQIPLLARGIVAKRFFAMLGPQLNFSVSNKVTLDGETIPGNVVNITYSLDEEIDQSVFGLGMTLGVGAYVIDRLSVDFRLYMGFLELYPDADDRLMDLSGARLMTMNFGVGYWFL